MYQYLTGRLVEKTPASVVLEVNGVGYHLPISVTTFSSLPEPGEAVRLLTHFVVREDAHSLYGFATEEERQMFRMLLSVTGIGPKVAITVLSGTALAELKQAIVDGSLAVLTAISGIGRKTAERMIVELREKLVVEERRVPSAAGSRAAVRQEVVEDSVRALVELGYRKQSARQAIEKALEQSDGHPLTVPELVRASLKHV